jgi:uncharacterized OB-fold protein
MSYSKPLPNVEDHATAPFWAGLAAHELRAQRCTSCGAHRLPAAPICPACLADGYQWVPVRDSGTLWSFVVYRRALSPAFAEDIPYAVGSVELDEGLFLLSRIDAPVDAIAIGDRMTARYDQVSDGVHLLTWVEERNTHG